MDSALCAIEHLGGELPTRMQTGSVILKKSRREFEVPAAAGQAGPAMSVQPAGPARLSPTLEVVAAVAIPEFIVFNKGIC